MELLERKYYRSLSQSWWCSFSLWLYWLKKLHPVVLSWRLKVLQQQITFIPTEIKGPCPHCTSNLKFSTQLDRHVLCLSASAVISSITIQRVVNLDSDLTGPSVRAARTLLVRSQTRLPTQAPFPPTFHPDAACAVIPLKCKPQIQLCLLWLSWPSVNTQCCHNVTITAGQYFNNNLFSQLQLPH